MDFMEKLHSGYYSGNGFPYVSITEAKTDNTKRYERERYEANSRKRHVEFKADALEELSLTNHPKAHLLFNKAWEMGHSSGYSEVWYYMCELEELVR